MDWFSGPIEKAISEVKNRKTVLIVFVKGTDEKSQALEPVFDSDDIVQLCSSCVCLKLTASSTEAAQFSAIYAVLSVPSVYLISCDGVPLETIIGDISNDELLKKMKNTLQKSNLDKPLNMSLTPDPEPSTSSQTNQNLEEKLAKAQSLLQIKRATELEEAKEMEKQKEFERRELGKKMKEFKEKQREKEQEELSAEIRRRRKEEKEARERIKRQIEEDRREKQQRYETERTEERTKLEEALAEKRKKQSPPRSAMAPGVTRIQFRFNDGRTLTQQFQSTASLNEVRDFLIESAPEDSLPTNLRSNFILGQLYPKRTFVDSDYNASLENLGLSPASALIVMPHEGFTFSRSTSSHDNSALMVFNSVLNFFMWPFYFIWNLLMSIFSSNSRGNSSHSAPLVRNNSASDGQTSVRQSSRKETKSSTVRREGNTARLRNMDDDDNDNATWNGNSTQQM